MLSRVSSQSRRSLKCHSSHLKRVPMKFWVGKGLEESGYKGIKKTGLICEGDPITQCRFA